MHFEAPGNEEGSIPAFEAFCARLAPELQLCVEGEPVCYVAEDPDDEWGAGDYRGGFRLSLAWRRGSATAPARLSDHCAFTGEVLDKVWCLASGQQYLVASYRLRDA
ncbi:Slc24a1 [Symbiodinium microadriaticum]|nr:Slc24a1 [Symbiodinium microadriaticum]